MQQSKLNVYRDPNFDLTKNHRLSFTLTIAIIFDGMLTFGINTTPVKKVQRPVSSIEVNLVHEHFNTALSQVAPPGDIDDKTFPKEHISQKPKLQKTTPNPLVQKSKLKIPIAKKTPLVPNAEQLINRALAMASLRGEIQSNLNSSDNNSRHKYISVATKEYKYAAYMEAWRAKVERIGNINYPNKAREKGLSGNLSLDVSLRQDGTVKEINIRRSSGYDVLDDAAIQIVKLAAPFAPFPKGIKDEVDILHVTRTWKFVNDQKF